jgi:signal transduction histidine kinase
MLDQCGSVIMRIDQTLNAVRRIATSLRPSVLDQLGLAAALEWQGQEFRTRTGIEVKMTISSDGAAIPDDLGSSAFRILQESLTNILRHARATQVTILLDQKPDELLLEITDNGVGAPPQCLDGTKSLGVVGMRERALACGGEFTVSGYPNHGTTVSLRVPLYPGASK